MVRTRRISISWNTDEHFCPHSDSSPQRHQKVENSDFIVLYFYRFSFTGHFYFAYPVPSHRNRISMKGFLCSILNRFFADPLWKFDIGISDFLASTYITIPLNLEKNRNFENSVPIVLNSLCRVAHLYFYRSLFSRY